jgi:hypothetical protein
MALGDNCASACTTRDHATFGECLRGFGVLGAATARNNAWDKELHAYQDAVKQGIQPAGTTQKKVDDAVRISHELGRPYNAEARVVVEQ